MSNLAPFPNLRMRRMRRDEFSRRLMRENILSVDDLIYPLFIVEGEKQRVAIASMPDQCRLSIGQIRHTCHRTFSRRAH